MMSRILVFAFALLTAASSVGPRKARAESVADLSHAAVLGAGEATGPARQAVPLLIDEIAKRSHASWRRVGEWPADRSPLVIAGRWEEVAKIADAKGLKLPWDVRSAWTAKREGYRIGAGSEGGRPLVWVAGNDDRGVLFGAGRLLRALAIRRRSVTLPEGFRLESAPTTALRGIQLGYRPKTNSYDAWTLPMWEQYYRDLIVFGCNAVELIPPRSDDDDDSPHFPRPKLEMMASMSRLADAYGLDVWSWHPAMDADYNDPAIRDFALKEWAEVFRALPRLDAVFVPGGDPGHTHPKPLFELLERQTASLKRYHPRAAMWVSPQSFSKEWLDEFFKLLNQESTRSWLTGVVHGPQNRLDLPAFRKAVPAWYPVRDYPDITHSRHCQYPVPDWDLAFAVSEGRETINPRPDAMARIYRRSSPHTDGFIVYSEGCNDDVNKIVWLGLGWDGEADVRAILRDYGRYFLNPDLGDRFADGLFALETNWRGPVLKNEGIDATLAALQTLEREADPFAKRNWRFQQALYRAYYDAAIRARLRHETQALTEAQAKLSAADSSGADRALDEADAILDRARVFPPPNVAALQARTRELAEALFQSIVMQLSVPKYQAIAVERGANLDGLDFPLTDASWLQSRIADARRAPTPADRIKLAQAALHRTDPGPGGFYDDLGDPHRQPRLLRGLGADADPAFYESSLISYSVRGAVPPADRPLAWHHHAESLYDAPLVMKYKDLDRSASYRVRVVYARESRAWKVRMTADDRFTIHEYTDHPFEPLEFDVPRAATADGELVLNWVREQGQGGSGRGCQVAEVWLLKQP